MNRSWIVARREQSQQRMKVRVRLYIGHKNRDERMIRDIYLRVIWAWLGVQSVCCLFKGMNNCAIDWFDSGSGVLRFLELMRSLVLEEIVITTKLSQNSPKLSSVNIQAWINIEGKDSAFNTGSWNPKTEWIFIHSFPKTQNTKWTSVYFWNPLVQIRKMVIDRV